MILYLLITAFLVCNACLVQSEPQTIDRFAASFPRSAAASDSTNAPGEAFTSISSEAAGTRIVATFLSGDMKLTFANAATNIVETNAIRRGYKWLLGLPSDQPSSKPTLSPPTYRPSTLNPTIQPSTLQPSTFQPSTLQPSTFQPSTNDPTFGPSTAPPSLPPSEVPSADPSTAPAPDPTTAPTYVPSMLPVASPTVNPSGSPSLLPVVSPTLAPSVPTVIPSEIPSAMPAGDPTRAPSFPPTIFRPPIRSLAPLPQVPSAMPSVEPNAPTQTPVSFPTAFPSAVPSIPPVDNPTLPPSAGPSLAPIANPTASPSTMPSATPIAEPTQGPTIVTSSTPSLLPSPMPIVTPTASPSTVPSVLPVADPTLGPTLAPSEFHSAIPSQSSSFNSIAPFGRSPAPSGAAPFAPSMVPSQLDLLPSSHPSTYPVYVRTESPSHVSAPSAIPSLVSADPSAGPTRSPENVPTAAPTVLLTTAPSASPSGAPVVLPTLVPTAVPSAELSPEPTLGPTDAPVGVPSADPSVAPSLATALPSAIPSNLPVNVPSEAPTVAPAAAPSAIPSAVPVLSPTVAPYSATPSVAPVSLPSAAPSEGPVSVPSAVPSAAPVSATPVAAPSEPPSEVPSNIPVCYPSTAPSALPSVLPSADPISEPSSAPAGVPTAIPSLFPITEPSAAPSQTPASVPSAAPSGAFEPVPTAVPSAAPFDVPNSVPSAAPSIEVLPPSEPPTHTPSVVPSAVPFGEPSAGSTNAPFAVPSAAPSQFVPSVQPAPVPSAVPSNMPLSPLVPSIVPSLLPVQSPVCTPSTVPSLLPTESVPTLIPSAAPSGTFGVEPSAQPSEPPSEQLSVAPTQQGPTTPTAFPTQVPVSIPSALPSVSQDDAYDDAYESRIPSAAPSTISGAPSTTPPSDVPTSLQPTPEPTPEPSAVPSANANVPSTLPTALQSAVPSMLPTTHAPGAMPTSIPSTSAPSTSAPTAPPTVPVPTAEPSFTSSPTETPTALPTARPTISRSVQPSIGITATPSGAPSPAPTSPPTIAPSANDTSSLVVSFYSNVTLSGLTSVTFDTASQASVLSTNAVIMVVPSTAESFIGSVAVSSTTSLVRIVKEASSHSLQKLSLRRAAEPLAETFTVIAITLTQVPMSALKYPTPQVLYDSVTALLTNAVQSGAYTSALATSAVVNGATELDGVIATNVSSSPAVVSQVTMVPTPAPTHGPRTTRFTSAQRNLLINLVSVVPGIALMVVCAYAIRFRRPVEGTLNQLKSLNTEYFNLVVRGVTLALSVNLLLTSSGSLEDPAFTLLLASRLLVFTLCIVFFLFFSFPAKEELNSVTGTSLLIRTDVLQESNAVSVYSMVIVMGLFDTSVLRYLPWFRTSFTTVMDGYPNVLLVRCSMYGTFFSSVIQTAAGIPALIDYNETSELTTVKVILLQAFSVFNIVRSFMSIVLYMKKIKDVDHRVAIVSEEDVNALADFVSSQPSSRPVSTDAHSPIHPSQISDMLSVAASNSSKSNSVAGDATPTLNAIELTKMNVESETNPMHAEYDADDADDADDDAVSEMTEEVEVDDRGIMFLNKTAYADETVNILRDQVRLAGLRPLEFIPLPKLKAELETLFGYANSGTPYDTDRLDYLLMCLDHNPAYKAEQEAANRAWRADIDPFLQESLSAMKAFIPPHIFQCSEIALHAEFGYSKTLAKRIMSKKCLWLVRISTKDIDRMHIAELNGRFNPEAQNLDFVEAAAIFAVLPAQFGLDADRRKTRWRASIEQNIKAMYKQYQAGALSGPKKRNPAYKDQIPAFHGRSTLHEMGVTKNEDAFAPRTSFQKLGKSSKVENDASDSEVVATTQPTGGVKDVQAALAKDQSEKQRVSPSFKPEEISGKSRSALTMLPSAVNISTANAGKSGETSPVFKSANFGSELSKALGSRKLTPPPPSSAKGLDGEIRDEMSTVQKPANFGSELAKALGSRKLPSPPSKKDSEDDIL